MQDVFTQCDVVHCLNTILFWMYYIRKYVAKPKKTKKATTSVMVVNIMLEAIAGSALNFCNKMGIKMPDKPAIVKVIVIAIANKMANLILENKKYIVIRDINPNSNPFKKPIDNSLIIIFE